MPKCQCQMSTFKKDQCQLSECGLSGTYLLEYKDGVHPTIKKRLKY